MSDPQRQALDAAVAFMHEQLAEIFVTLKQHDQTDAVRRIDSAFALGVQVGVEVGLEAFKIYVGKSRGP